MALDQDELCIQPHWESYRRDVLTDFPDALAEEMRRIFYDGAWRD